MDIACSTDKGNVVITIPSGYTNSSEEDLEIIINVSMEADEPDYEPDCYEPEYVPSVMDVAANSVADSFTNLIKIAAGLWLIGMVMSIFQ